MIPEPNEKNLYKLYCLKDVVIYIIALAIVAFFVFRNHKKSKSNYRSRSRKSFKRSYLEKKKEKIKEDNNENLH